jgi:Sec-independent protein translocase protein TatA
MQFVSFLSFFFPVRLAFGFPAAPEWIFIGSLALLLLGPKKMPQVARQVAHLFGEFQKAQEAFRRELLEIPQLPEIQKPSSVQELRPLSLKNDHKKEEKLKN